MNKFIDTEEQISKRMGLEITDPIRVFNLANLGIDQKAFITLMQSNIANLEWDYYDVRKAKMQYLIKAFPAQEQALKKPFIQFYKGDGIPTEIETLLKKLSPKQLKEYKDIKPFRKRAIAKFMLGRNEKGWQINRKPVKALGQNVDDYRSIARVFKETPESLSEHPLFKELLLKIADLTQSVSKTRLQTIRMVAHEMHIVASKHKSGDNSPEGTHQDGCDYIVSAIVVERSDISGGESVIYLGRDQTPLLHYTLQEGEGIFQADTGTNLWHTVTPVHLSLLAEKPIGTRTIIGFDIDGF